MKKTIIAVGIIFAQAAGVAAYAQGLVGPVREPSSTVEASPQERAAAKEKRRMEARKAARKQPAGLVGPVRPATTPNGMSRAERKEDRAEHRAETAEANRAGELKSPGLVGPTKAK